jgi:hypothetical protein
VVEQAEFGGPDLSPGFEPATWILAWAAGITVLAVVLVVVGIAIYRTAKPPLGRLLRRRLARRER